MARVTWSDLETMGGIGAWNPLCPAAPSDSVTLLPERTLKARLARILRMGALWRARMRQRQALAQLDAHMLRDVGITRCDALRECEKPFWR